MPMYKILKNEVTYADRYWTKEEKTLPKAHTVCDIPKRNLIVELETFMHLDPKFRATRLRR